MSESSPAACRFAIPERTAFCFLLGGLLNIDSPLMLVSFAGRDDADDFLFAIFILHAIYGNNQQRRLLDRSNGVPTPFSGHDAILAEDYVGIVEMSDALSKATPPCFCWFRCGTAALTGRTARGSLLRAFQ